MTIRTGPSVRVVVPLEEIARRLRDRIPSDVELIVWDMDVASAPDDVDLLVARYHTDSSKLHAMGSIGALRHVHTMTLGYEWIIDHVPNGSRLHTAVGAVETSTSELAIALMLAAARRIPEAVEQKRSDRWLASEGVTLRGSRIVLLGYGGVGQRIERLLQAFEPAAIDRVASRARQGQDGNPIYGPESLEARSAECDFLVVAAPHSAETDGIVSRKILSRLRDGAILVNVARGRLIDQDALIEELLDRRIAAAVDVTHPEPLPAGHPLWSAPNLIITPHVGGNTSDYWNRVADTLVEQIGRLARGLPLEHEVTRTERIADKVGVMRGTEDGSID